MYRLAAEAPLSAVAIPTILYFTLLIVTVEPTLYFFSLAYAESATSTLALVSDALKVRPLVIFEEVSGPIADSVTSVPYTVYGTDVTESAIGPLTSSKITSGRTFKASETNAKVLVADSAYAKEKKYKVGSTVTINKV